MNKSLLIKSAIYLALAALLLLPVSMTTSCHVTRKNTDAAFRSRLLPKSALVVEPWQCKKYAKSKDRSAVTSWQVFFKYDGGWDSLVDHVKTVTTGEGFVPGFKPEKIDSIEVPVDSYAVFDCTARKESVYVSNLDGQFFIVVNYIL